MLILDVMSRGVKVRVQRETRRWKEKEREWV
jgi:hypothetical protein